MESLEDITETWRTNENEVFKRWKEGGENEKDLLLPLLLKLLQNHAYAVCWQKLRERRPEIVNDAIWVAIDKSRTFQGHSKFSTWFEAVVRNMCRMYLRDKITKKEVPLESVTEEAASSQGADSKMQLEEMTKKLNRRYQKLVALKLKGMSDAEIGTVLGIKELAVRHMWQRVKEKMKKVAQT